MEIIRLSGVWIAMVELNELVAEGNELAKKKNWEEALERYRAAAALDPSNPELHFLIGCCHFKMNYGQGARKAWMRALELDPDYEKARVWIHRVTGMSGKIPMAMNHAA